MKRFEYLAPESLEEALELMSDRPEAIPLAGGTDILVRMKEGDRSVEALLHSVANNGDSLLIQLKGRKTTALGGEIAGHLGKLGRFRLGVFGGRGRVRVLSLAGSDQQQSQENWQIGYFQHVGVAFRAFGKEAIGYAIVLLNPSLRNRVEFVDDLGSCRYPLRQAARS